VSALEEARDRFLERHGAFAATLPEEPGWLARLREEARSAFAERGLPHTKLEDWRYTNVTPLAKVPFELAEGPARRVEGREIEARSFPVFACSVFVFVDGRYQPELSSPRALSAGVRAESLAEVLARAPERLEPHLGRLADVKQHPFAALGTAFLRDGAVLEIPEGAALEQPIHLVFAQTAEGTPRVTHPRVLVVAGRGSRAVVIQDHVSLGEGAAFTNAVVEVELGANASLDWIGVQRENDAAFGVLLLATRQERDSRFAAHTLSLGGALVRNDVSATLVGEGAECRLRGLFVGHDDQLIDNHTLVDHAVPHGTSDELYKGVLGGRARAVFRGRVIVRPDAQKSDARQQNPNLLLSDRAQINTKPQLEIHADDVKCSHGSSIGQPEESTLFYLRSRGLSLRAARDLVVRGFAGEILRGLPLPALTEGLDEVLADVLRAASEDGEEAS